MDNSQNKTPPRQTRGNLREETGGNRGRVIDIPPVVEIVVVHVPLTVVPVHVTDIQVAIRVADICKTPPMTLPFECSQD